jgi:hypothetical protein
MILDEQSLFGRIVLGLWASESFSCICLAESIQRVDKPDRVRFSDPLAGIVEFLISPG